MSRGLEKLYEGEVLGRYPVVQHFVFGGIFRGDWKSEGKIREAPRNTFVGVGGVEPPMGRRGGPGGAGGVDGFMGTKAPWAK